VGVPSMISAKARVARRQSKLAGYLARTRSHLAALAAAPLTRRCETGGMRAVVQRVSRAEVRSADGESIGAIGPGLCVLVGVTHDDSAVTARKMADKVWHLRVMADDDGVMNCSVADSTREILVVSQFTLYGDTRGGRRPSWIAAAPPEHAEPVIEALVARLRELGAAVATGRFRTHMLVELINDGPVTVLLDV
jgi:D-aminoacyl-tRNA deacylase